MAAPRINPLHGVEHPGSSENGDFVFCEHSTSPLVISKALMEAVCNQVNDGVWAAPRGGGVEVGGLLVGAKSGANPVTVEQIVPISTEHRFGPFHLSPTDVEGLDQTIASTHHDQTHTVIGFYRSRTRGDAIPRESDQEILNTLARVHSTYEVDFRFFLIFTPLSKFVVEVSIAQRRDGGWHEWREFKLPTEPLSFLSHVSETESSIGRTKYPGLAMEPAPARAPVSASALPAPPRPQERAGNRPRLWLYGAIELVILAGATGANFWITTHRSEPAPLLKEKAATQSIPTGFAANLEGSMWKLTWNRDAVAALHPSGAVLSIRDGANEQQESLTEADLSTGTVFYTPQTGSLVFSLLLLTPGSLPVEEHVRVLEARSGSDIPKGKPEPKPPKKKRAAKKPQKTKPLSSRFIERRQSMKLTVAFEPPPPKAAFPWTISK